MAKAAARKADAAPEAPESRQVQFSTYEPQETPNAEDLNLTVEITGAPKVANPYTGE